MGSKGIVASTAALSVLLQEGIGDTIRISLTPEPGGDRTPRGHRGPGDPADHGLAVLHAHGHCLSRAAGAPPRRCSRSWREDIQSYIRARMPEWRETIPAFETLQLAVMGCIVNGPGESKHADIGISLPGTGEFPAAPVFIDGKKAMTLRGDDIGAQFKAIVEDYIAERWGRQRRKSHSSRAAVIIVGAAA